MVSKVNLSISDSNVMKKFLLKSSLMIVLTIVVIFALSIVLPYNPNHYMSAQQAKIARLDSLPSPRIIIVGGSNAAFGFNSERIEKELGINVVNTSIHASVGLKFSLRTAYDYARSGDIIVIIPEFTQFKSYENYRGVPDILASAVMYSGSKAWSRLDAAQVLMVVGGLPKHYLGVIKARQKSEWDYNGNNFNRWGDETAHWSATAPGNKEAINPKTAEISHRVITDVALKITDLEQRGADIIILWPTTIQSNHESYKPMIKSLEEHFLEKNVRFANHPQTFVHPDSMAFDTPYHMTYPAVELNTDSLIQIISLMLNQI